MLLRDYKHRICQSCSATIRQAAPGALRRNITVEPRRALRMQLGLSRTASIRPVAAIAVSISATASPKSASASLFTILVAGRSYRTAKSLAFLSSTLYVFDQVQVQKMLLVAIWLRA